MLDVLLGFLTCRGLRLSYIFVLKGATHYVLENEALRLLFSTVSDRLQLAFCPKTRKPIVNMFRTFIAFCIVTRSCIFNVSVKMVLSFLECLVSNTCSCYIIGNYVSALKAYFVLYDLPFEVLNHPKVKYFIKALKIKGSLAINSHNIITIPILTQISQSCKALDSGQIYRTDFLWDF